MYLVTKTIYLNIFKNFGAVKLVLELNLYHYTIFLPTGCHIATHKMLQLLKKTLWVYREVLQLEIPDNTGDKSVILLSGNKKNRYVGKKPLHCDS